MTFEAMSETVVFGTPSGLMTLQVHCLQCGSIVSVRKFPFLEVTPTLTVLGARSNK